MADITQLFKNNAKTTLNGTLSVGGTSINLPVGHGNRFPTPSGGDYFLVTLYENDGSANEITYEVVKCTARVGDVLTVVRDFEGLVVAAGGTSGGWAFPSAIGVNPSQTVYIELRYTAYAAGNTLNKDTNLLGLADVAAARVNLGLGSMATQNSNNVSITGGTISGVTLTDSTTLFADNLDNTKKMQFQLASIGAGLTRTVTFPNTDITLPGVNVANTWAVAQTFIDQGIQVKGTSTGYHTFSTANTGASNYTLALPLANDTLVGKATTDELTNKTLNASVAKGTWTASGTWTLPALTLGGAVTGGGQNVSGLGTLGCGAITATTGTYTKATAGDVLTFTNGGATPGVGYLYSGSGVAGFYLAAGASGTGYQLASSGAYIYSPNQTKYLQVTNTGIGITGDLNIGTGAITSGAITSSGQLVVSGTLAANAASSFGAAWAGGYAELYSWGANASTNGSFLFVSRRSDGTNTLIPLEITPTALTLGSGITSISGGTNPSLNIGTGALTAGSGAFSAGINVSGSYSLGVSLSAGKFSFEAPVFREYIGDGTGYSRTFSKRAASTTTDYVTISDLNGAMVFQNSSYPTPTSGQGYIYANVGNGLVLGGYGASADITMLDKNGVTRATVSSTGLAVTGAGSFTTGITVGQSGGASGIKAGLVDGYSYLSGGSSLSNGAVIFCFGESHATDPNIIQFRNGATVNATLDASGNLGLWVTPSTWSGVVSKVLEFQNGSAIGAQSNTYNLHLMRNAYFDNGWKYKNTAAAARFALNDDAGTGGFAWYYAGSGTAGTAISWTTAMTLDASGNLTPGGDNTQTLGSGSNRWSVVYAGTGTINTSDAREKTEVESLTPDEINAAKQLAKEIGSYKWLASVETKGDAARKHIGLTVQRAIEIMEANNLEPFAYGFICYDQWDDKFTEHPAIEAVEAVDATFDDEGNELTPAVEPVDGKDAWTEQTQTAGDRYAFRYDELNMFIAAGFEARIAALEAR